MVSDIGVAMKNPLVANYCDENLVLDAILLGVNPVLSSKMREVISDM